MNSASDRRFPRFYSSIAWQRCRDAYLQSVGGLCEACLEQGQYNPGEIVHHVIPIDETNVDDPEITLNFDNLRLLCREHHERIHRRTPQRYRIDESGRVTAMD